MDLSSAAEVQKSIWGGHIPVQFNLAATEVATLQPPEPFYILVPRLAYLPLYSDMLKDYFSQSGPSQIDEIWYESAGTPLKWHYPVGVLFDAFASALKLPWVINIHFQAYPTSQLARCPNLDTVKSFFMNSLKEANYLKHGDSTKTNHLSVTDIHDLWEGLRTNEPSAFWRTNSKLLPSDETKWKHMPVRVVRPNQPPQTDPIAPTDATGGVRTLGAVLSQMLPQQFSPSASAAKPTYLIQGISPPLETPITWLCEHLSHPDNFLYITVLTS